MPAGKAIAVEFIPGKCHNLKYEANAGAFALNYAGGVYV